MKLGSFIGGLAKSLDERLQDDMRRTQERSERVRDYHIRRSTEKQERFEAEQRELEEVLTNLASLVEDAEVPEGMNKMDYAAQLYKAGGGTVSGGQQFYANLSDARLKGTKVSDVVTFADMQTGGRKVGDYVDQFVKRPETLVKVPEGLKGGVGFLAKADITKGLDEEMQTMFGTPKDVEKFDIGQATIDYGKLPGAVEYGLGMDLKDIQLRTAKANLAGIMKDNALKGSIDTGDVYKQYNEVLKAHAGKAGLAFDVDSTGAAIFNVKTGTQGYTELQGAYAKALRNVAENAAGSLNVPGMKETLKTLSTSALGYLVPNDPTKTGNTNYQVGDLILDKNGDTILYLGPDELLVVGTKS